MKESTFYKKVEAIKKAASSDRESYPLKAEDDAPKNFIGDIRANASGVLTAYPSPTKRVAKISRIANKIMKPTKSK